MFIRLNSIRLRLIVYMVAASALVFPVSGLIVYYEIRSMVLATVDEHIHAEVQLIAGLVELEHDDIDVELSNIAVGEYSVPLSGHYYQLITVDTPGDVAGALNVMARSPSLSIVGATLPLPSADLLGKVLQGYEPSLFHTVEGPDLKPHRLNEEVFTHKGKTIIVQVSESLTDEHKLLSTLKGMLVLVFVVVMLLFVSVALLVTLYSLRGLGNFAARLRKINAKTLGERLELEGADDELVPFVVSFNSMMESLEDSFEAQRRFLTDASHELRTPTSVVKTISDVTLSNKVRSEEEYREALVKIAEATATMAQTIDSILRVARLDSDMLALKIERVNLLEAVKDAVALVSTMTVGRATEITVEGVEVFAECDREKITEAVVNLLTNALKYSSPGAGVTVRTGELDEGVFIEVRDKGVGIPEKDLPHIYDRFFRSDRARQSAGGTGLGLSIVKRVVDVHGATIDVDSEVGRGTVFRVRLSSKFKG